MRTFFAGCIGAALLSSAGAAHAGSYANHAFSYAIELPVGWSAVGAEDANPAEFAGPDGIVAKLRAIPRPQALTPELVQKLSHGDEEKVFAKFSKAKAIPVASVPLAKLDTSHYGFVYIDGRAEPRVLHFAVASQPATAGHTWYKLQFAYPRLKHATAAPSIDSFIKSFHWTQPVVARSASPSIVPAIASGMVPVGQVGSADVNAALNAYTAATAAADARSAGPPGEVQDADSTYYLSLNKKMSEKDTQAHIETFRGNGEKRTEEEMARARSYGMGDVLKPNE